MFILSFQNWTKAFVLRNRKINLRQYTKFRHVPFLIKFICDGFKLASNDAPFEGNYDGWLILLLCLWNGLVITRLSKNLSASFQDDAETI